MDERPRKRDKEASKQAFLRAGLSAFATHGYDAATTKLIAAEAGLNEQLITRYFGGKAGLLLALVGSFVDGEAIERNYPPVAADVETEIRQFLLHRNRRYLELQDFFRAFVPLSMRDASIRDSLEAIVFRQTAVLRERLLERQKGALIRADVDLEAVSLMIGGQSFHISFLLRVNTNLRDELLMRMISEFARCMARGLAPPPP
jgi:AcrR family transcriptional regulator